MRKRDKAYPARVSANMQTRQRRLFSGVVSGSFIFLLLIGVLCHSGCTVRRRTPMDVKYYLLDIERPGEDLPEKGDVCMRVRPCRMADSFAGRSLVYRTSSVLYEPDYYNLFLTNPDAQITDALRSWFRRAGYGMCVSTEETSIQRYALEPRVDLLCADFTDKAKPVASVRMHVLVTTLDKSCSCVKTVIDKTYSANTLLPVNPSAAQVVQGLTVSISTILQQMENDLSDAM
jgi:uncharacterized lipoprotein YmbA